MKEKRLNRTILGKKIEVDHYIPEICSYRVLFLKEDEYRIVGSKYLEKEMWK